MCGIPWPGIAQGRDVTSVERGDSRDMPPMLETDQVCAAPCASGIGAAVPTPHDIMTDERRPVSANSDNHPRDAVAPTAARRGLEQGNL